MKKKTVKRKIQIADQVNKSIQELGQKILEDFYKKGELSCNSFPKYDHFELTNDLETIELIYKADFWCSKEIDLDEFLSYKLPKRR